jgi:hypothetical protein
VSNIYRSVVICQWSVVSGLCAATFGMAVQLTTDN